jgi:cytidylate kinase
MTAQGFQPVVTVSATYGAGGSVIAPRLAEVLALPFIDRLISADLSQDAARAEERSAEGLCEGEREIAPAGRFLSYFARAASVGAMLAPEPIVDDDDTIRLNAEAALREVVAGDPAVILGRAGAVALRDRPRTFHIRLDGPIERRVDWAAQFEHLSAQDARKRASETDRTRTLFVKRLYHVDPADPALYHLIIDPTVMGVEPAVAVISAAARAFFEAHPENA